MKVRRYKIIIASPGAKGERYKIIIAFPTQKERVIKL